jgi:hypothetical protein
MKIISTLSLIKPFKMFPLIVLNYSKYYVPKKMNVDQNLQSGGTSSEKRGKIHFIEVLGFNFKMVSFFGARSS